MKYLIPFLILILAVSCGQKEQENTENMQEKTNETTTEMTNEEHHVDSLLKVGGNITSATQDVLLKNVSQAMGSGGKEHAVRFCSLKATDLVDSLSNLYKCEIFRISEKNRNPNNAPHNDLDQKMLKKFAESNDVHSKEVIHVDDKHVYYQPIFIQKGACMVCHGEVGTIVPDEFYAVINEKYPEDKATGYKMGDLRGAWKIVFN